MIQENAVPSLIVLGLGSNRGNSRHIILNAIAMMKQSLSGLKRASLYETDPLYVTRQNKFINTAVSGFYTGTPRELLYYISYIEARFGRDRALEIRWGERLLDIDILLFGDQVVKEANLNIPHPMLKERRFALEPLLELLPDAIEPDSGILYRDICSFLPDQGVKKLTEENLDKDTILPEST